MMLRRWLVPAVILAAAAVPAGPAQALITPVTVVAGPSSGILGVGNVAIAPDGTGGVVWRQLAAGVAHIFVSRFRGGAWSAPIQVDAGQPGPATFPAIAAGDGGRLLVVWVEPWVSQSTGGNPPTTLYQLVSSLMEPSSDGFGPVVQVDPNDVGDASAVYPSLAMAPDGTAYVVYRVVDYAYPPNLPVPQGDPTQLRPGGELIDVRVARFNGLFWNALGSVNTFPGQVTMRRPTASNAPVIAIDLTGGGLVLWQEPTIDGVARIWGRRLFGSTLGIPLEVSPERLQGTPVTVDADAPTISFSDFAEAKVAFRLAGGPGSSLATPHVFVNTLLSEFVPGADKFTGAVDVGGAPSVGPPSVAVDNNGDFQVGFTAGGTTDLVRGNETTTGPLQSLGPAAGDPALATLDPDQGGAVVWPTLDVAGRPVLDVQQTFPDGGGQRATLSAPISGPISELSIGPSGLGDALIAYRQGLSSTSQVVVAAVQVPPHKFFVFVPLKWVGPRGERITWEPAQNVIGQPTYSVVVDGQTRARGLHGLGYRFSPRGLGAGVHQVVVIATDAGGEQTSTPPARLEVDPNPPRVSIRRLVGARVIVRVHDPNSGARASGTVISFGDGTSNARNRLTVAHRYRAPGRYLVTVRCANRVGIHALHHLWVQVR